MQFIQNIVKLLTTREPKWEGYPAKVLKLDRFLTQNNVVSLHVVVTTSTRHSFIANGSLLGRKSPYHHLVRLHCLNDQLSVQVGDQPRKVFTVPSASEEDLQPVITYLQDYHLEYVQNKA